MQLSYFCAANSINQNMPFYLLQANTNNAVNYLPIVLQIFFAVGLVATIIWGSNLLGPKRVTSDKLQNFESGIEIKEMPVNQWP